MATFLKRAVAAFIILLALLVLATWLITRDTVTRLRSIAKVSPPVPPRVAMAIRAAESFPIDRPSRSLRSVLPPPRGTVACGPWPIAFVLVRWLSRPRRALGWHFETTVRTLVVERIFTPDELLRVFAHEVYLGRINGKNIYGVEPASRIYFGKAAGDLSIVEAATIAAMIRQPNVYSPLKNPQRALERRDWVLAQMVKRGSIRQTDYSQDEPISPPNTSSAARTP